MDPQDRFALAEALEAALRKALIGETDPLRRLDVAVATLERILVSNIDGDRSVVAEISDRATISAIFDHVRLRLQRELDTAKDSSATKF